MAKPKNSSRRVVEIILIVAIVLCVGLVLVEVTTNLTAEIAPQTQTETIIEDRPPALPTLTEEERRGFLSEPVGEEGNE